MSRSSTEETEASMERLVVLLRQVGMRIDEAVRGALAAIELVPREFAVLSLLAEAGPASQQEVANQLGIDRTTMVSLVDRLEEKALVARERDAQDRRAYKLMLQPEGVKRRRQAARALQQHEARFLGTLAERDFKKLLRLLETLGE